MNILFASSVVWFTLVEMLQSARLRPRPSARRLALLLAVFRTFAVLLALQVGGVVHGAIDVLGAVVHLEEAHEQCPQDGSCDDCPAGCPNCHCANAMRLVVTEAVASSLFAPGSTSTSAPSGAADDFLPGPALPSVYRPPRA